jgi:glycosyltransferase involved in cell wall biosynthesis
MRVLILSPGHPALQAGGAERAAYSLFERLRGDRRVRCVAFAAPRTSEARGHLAPEPNVRLVGLPDVHAFSFRSKDRARLELEIGELIAAFDPDVVHLHHFLHWSVEVPEIVRSHGRACVLTLHEYGLICTHLGQLVTPAGDLCVSSTPAACARCFPDIDVPYFQGRQEHLQRAIGACSALITPSAFARDRLVQWGLADRTLAVIENLLSPETLKQVTPRHPSAAGGPVIVGYFGQVTPFKGIDVLLRAIESLPEETRERIHLSVYGANLEGQTADFQARINKLLRELDDCVTFMGPYDNTHVHELMGRCDWVVLPSIWWENSPVVIQEAALAGRPVLCSRIGGMAEKVQDGVTGLHFEAGSVADLADRIEQIAEGLSIGVEPRAASAVHPRLVEQFLALYREVLQAPGQRRTSGRRFKPKLAPASAGSENREAPAVAKAL